MPVGTVNVIRKRLGTKDSYLASGYKKGLDYKDRLPGFAKMRKDMGALVLSTSESGRYVDADLLSDAFGPKWENILHGDNGDLTSAIHWPSDILKMLDEGKYTTKGSHHNWATWVDLQDIATGVIFQMNATHLEYRARGNKTITEWDKLRGEQAKIWVAKGVEQAEKSEKKYGVSRVPIVFSGDMNQDDDDTFDIVGDEMAKAGFVDAEKQAKSKSGPDTTYPNLPGYPPSHRRFDRIFVPKGTVVEWMRTVVGPPNTDHNGVSALVTLSNERI